LSISDFIRIFFTEGIHQPFFPEWLGAFGYPIWAMWCIASFGLITQGIADPKTTRQKRFQFVVVSIFLLGLIWGAVNAFFYTLEVI